MRQTGKTVIRTSILGGGVLFRSLVGFTLLGIVLAVVAVLFTLPRVNRGCSVDAPGGLFPQCGTAALVLLLFLVGCPLAFGLAGRAHGVASLVARSITHIQAPVATALARNVMRFATRRGLDLARLGAHERIQAVVQGIRRLDDQPRAIRWMSRAVLSQVPYRAALHQFLTEHPFEQLSPEEIEQQLAMKMEAIFAEHTVEPDLTMLWILVGMTVLLSVTIRLMLGA